MGNGEEKKENKRNKNATGTFQAYLDDNGETVDKATPAAALAALAGRGEPNPPLIGVRRFLDVLVVRRSSTLPSLLADDAVAAGRLVGRRRPGR